MSNNDKHAAETLKLLKSGTLIVKQKPNGKKLSRRFYLHDREGFITYERSRKLFGKPRVYQVKDIDEIRTGISGPAFDRLVKRGVIRPTDEPRVFSIMYDNHRKEEHFIASDAKTRELWTNGLQHLISRHSQKTQGHLIQEEKWILDFFHEADRNHSGSLSKTECKDLLMKSLHVELPDRTFEQMFNKADASKEGLLNADEFINFFHTLTRRKDLYEIMKKYIKNEHAHNIEEIYMDKDELLSFLRLYPNQALSFLQPEQIQNVIDEHEMNTELRNKGRLSLDGFRNMLLSSSFDILGSYQIRHIYQDMTRPLCDYYINTSHNTYLFYSQLSGDSNPEAYNRVLFMGCRAVELDCYDGDDGQPIVYHAYTLVKPCTFESIIRAIEPNLFKTSPYPVILNIENHCSLEQQKQMAYIMKSILGDRLLTESLPNKDPSFLPSPEDLKYKVLIRSKKKATPTKVFEAHADDTNPLVDQLSRNVEPELAELFIYLQNVPYRDYDYAKQHYSSLHSSSLEENNFYKFAESDAVGLVQQTTWRLLRLYPGGLRQDSSNVDPTHAWNFGVQLVALNYQNDDDSMALCYGKFLDNGGCGYVLKPEYLLNAEETQFNPFSTEINFDHPQTLTITIISGQFLPRLNVKSSDIPDPYVKISTHGIRCDEHVEKTKVVDNNGFDPVWNETFRFRIRYPQLCLMYFSVMDYDALSADDKIAVLCAPVTMLQPGYRHIHLRANSNDQTYSTLFVHIDVQYDDDDVDIISTRF